MTATNPCWCEGPWIDTEPADRPETRLGREHEQGADGCSRLPRRLWCERNESSTSAHGHTDDCYELVR